MGPCTDSIVSVAERETERGGSSKQTQAPAAAAAAILVAAGGRGGRPLKQIRQGEGVPGESNWGA